MTIGSGTPGTRIYWATVLSASLLSGLLVSGLALPASANNTSAGSMSSLSGSKVTVTNGARQSRSIVSLHQMHAHHGHHRHHDIFADGFFPFGFGVPVSEPDLTAAADDSEGIDWHRPPYWLRLDRYEPPTVEKSPSGVTIIRGPGSHHGFSPY